MGYGYMCVCPECGYTLSAVLGNRTEPTERSQETEYRVFRCETCGHYEVHPQKDSGSCIRCQGQLQMIDEFDEQLFGGNLQCPNCHGHLTVGESIQEREWNTQRRYRETVESTPASSKGNENQYITFGYYPQGPNAELKPIIWQILKKEQDKMLLISRESLDSRQYHDTEEKTTWEQSSIRRWLNKEFLNTAFTKSQQKQIVTTDIITDGDSVRGTDGGNTVQDKIYLLSLEEVRELFGYTSNEKNPACEGLEICEPTEYAMAFRKAVVKEGSTSWWLRSPGADNLSAAYVDRSFPEPSGDEFYEEHGVRPAMWVAL